MIEYTKQERLEIYKEALRSMQVGNERCICIALNMATNWRPDIVLCSADLEPTFPEIYAVKPEDAPNDGYWWPQHHKRIRIATLKGVINQMEKDLKKGGVK